MKIKIKNIVTPVVFVGAIALYLKSVYIWITHLSLALNRDESLFMRVFYRPFVIDYSGGFNYDIATENTWYYFIFNIGFAVIISITVIYYLLYIQDREISIGENK